jgi:tetratricopeptide (TPR) repeat protein
MATKALRWAPMDWQLYYDLAVAESLYSEKSIPAAMADFQRARFLQPTVTDLPYNEGVVWLHVRPALVFQAWKAALQQYGPSDQSPLFDTMMQAVTDNPESLPTLERLAGDNVALQLIYCKYAPRKEAAQMIQEILDADPALGKLSDDQKKTFFQLWAHNVDPSLVAQRILANPGWLPAGWPVAIDYLVSIGDYRRAYEITRKFAPPPSSPPNVEITTPRAALAARFYADSSDFAAGVALCQQYLQSGQADDALVQSEKMTARDDCPAYIFALQAGLFAGKNQWRQAFESLKKSPPPAP